MMAHPAPAGKSFFKKKKQPVPVRLTGKDWAAQIRKACEATYLFWSGTTICWMDGTVVAFYAMFTAPLRQLTCNSLDGLAFCRRQQPDHQGGAVIAERAAMRGERAGGHQSSSREGSTQVGWGAGELQQQVAHNRRLHSRCRWQSELRKTGYKPGLSLVTRLLLLMGQRFTQLACCSLLLHTCRLCFSRQPTAWRSQCIKCFQTRHRRSRAEAVGPRD